MHKLKFLFSVIFIAILLSSCQGKSEESAKETSKDKPKAVEKAESSDDEFDPFADDKSESEEKNKDEEEKPEQKAESRAEQLLRNQLESLEPANSDKKLSDVERAKLLATAKILRAAKTNIPNPGPYKLVELEGGAEVWQARGELGEFGGTLNVSIFGPGPKTFNVWAANEVPSKGLCYLMFERLVDIDAWTGKLVPRLAKEVTVSDDKLEYSITLRKGLTWSDGEALTADDVVYTFNTIVKKGYGNSSTRDVLSVKGNFPTVTKVDDLTVSFKTKEPFAPFLYGISNVLIAPKHILSKVTEKPMKEFHSFWDINCDPETMVTSGPFKLKRYVAGQRVELVRNSKYSMVDKHGRRLPYLDKLIEIIVPDQNTQVIKFYGEEVDFLDIRSVRGFDAALMKQREKTDNFTMYNLGPDDGTTFLMFNLNRRVNPETGKPYVDKVKQTWFNNLYFRRAVSLAIDRQRLVDNILKGVGIPIYAHYSAGSPWYNAKLKHYGQNLEKAKSYLKKGGFELKDDKLYDRNGNRVEFVLQTNAGNTARDGTCVMIQNDLKKLGMKVNYQPIDFNILIDSVSTKLNWDAVLMGLTGNKIEPYDSANVWKSDGRLHMFDQRLPDEKGNFKVTDARLWEKDIDDCFNRGASTLDSKKRKIQFDKFQKIAFDKVPFIYLYSMLDISAARNTIGNYKPTPLGISYPPKGTFHNIEEIYKKDGGK